MPLNVPLFHAPKSSLENPSWSQKTGPRSFVSISYGELDQYEGHWVCDETTGDEGFLDEHEDIFWMYDEDQCYWMKYPFRGRSLRKGSKSKEEAKESKESRRARVPQHVGSFDRIVKEEAKAASRISGS